MLAVWCCMCPRMLEHKACRNCTKNLIATYQGAWCTLNKLWKSLVATRDSNGFGPPALTPLPRPSLSLKMISLGLNHRARKNISTQPVQRLSSPCYRLCSSNRWPLDLDFAVGCAHVLRVAIKSKYVRFTASGDLSTILQRTRVKEGSKNHKETTMAMSKSYKSLCCTRTNIHKASSFVIARCTPLRVHFTLISKNNWKDAMTTCTVKPAKQTCKPRISGLYRFSRDHFQVPAVRFRGWINRSSLTSLLPIQVTCNRISPPVVPAADVQAPTELASSQLPSCHRMALEAAIFQDIWIHGNCNKKLSGCISTGMLLFLLLWLLGVVSC